MQASEDENFTGVFGSAYFVTVVKRYAMECKEYKV
jgi:hypothetical protein